MLRKVILAVPMVTVACSVAEASCRQDDLTGSWSMSVVGLSADDTFVGLCTFRIAADGGVSGSCEAHDLEDSFEGKIDGNFAISSTCRVSGSFATQDIPSDVQASMNHSKDVITGISLSPGTINQFTAVKR